MNEGGYEFFVVETDDVQTRDLGLRSFRVRPCRGDYITTIDAYGVEQAFEVSAVIHPLESSDDEPVELIVRHWGRDAALRMALRADRKTA